MNDNYYEDDEIDLLNVFEIMNKRKGLFFRIIALLLSVSILFSYFIFLLNKSDSRVQSIITYNYAGASEGKAPSGGALDTRGIVSSYVLDKALQNVNLSKNIPIEALKNNIEIEHILSEETRKNLELVSTKLEADKKEISDAIDFELVYGNQYIVSLKNEFGEDKIKLPKGELSALLNAVIVAYKDYFYETYADQTLPKKSMDYVNIGALDYFEALDFLEGELKYLSSYCDSLASSYPTWRSAKDGMSFANLRQDIDTYISTDINYLYSYIFFNGVPKNKELVLSDYQYTLRNLNLELEKVKQDIADTESIIANYENDKILMIMSENSGTQNADQVSDYYNELILRQVDLYKRQSNIEKNISECQEKIDRINSPEQTMRKERVEGEINELLLECKELSDKTFSHAEEFVTSEYYKNKYINAISAQIEKNKVEFKKMIIIMAVALFIGVCWWGADALFIEIKGEGDKQ